MVAAQALDCADLAIKHRLGKVPNRVARRKRIATAVQNAQLRPTRWAAGRLRVKATIGRVVILGLAGRAHRKTGHRRAGSIIRRSCDNCQARPAIGAVEKWIPVPSVTGIEQFGQAIVTCRNVRRDKHITGLINIAWLDVKLTFALLGKQIARQLLDASQRRRLGDQFRNELIDDLPISFYFDEDAAGTILNEARQVQAPGQAVHERAKSHALNDALHSYRASLHDFSSLR
jgi:hypothetical protein